MMGEPAVGKRLLLIPAVLGVVGLTQMSVHLGDGMGLAGTRERAALLGGTLFAGREGPGWTVRMELPR